MRAVGLGATEQVRVSGGGARGALWLRILANVLATGLVPVEASEGAAFGAALLAGVGAGAWPDVLAASQSIPLRAPILPDPAQTERYQRVYGVYRALYPALKPSFAALAE